MYDNREEGRFSLTLFLVVGWFYAAIARALSLGSAATRWTVYEEEKSQPVAQSMAFCRGTGPGKIQSVKESVTTVD
jgi:hypothetical protein